jgi:DNA-binding CsgD family transcriptional regulator
MKRLQNLATAANRGVGIDRLRGTMDEIATEMGLGRFAYLGVPLYHSRGAEPILIATYPKDWTDCYLANRFERIDPVISTAVSGHLPFFWGSEGDVVPENREEERLFDEAAAFGIRHGWTVPVHDARGQVATMNFSCGNGAAAFRESVERNLQELHLLAIYFHAAVTKANAEVPSRSALPALSRREIEALQWAARGKSRADTAQIMGIRPRTVKFHLESCLKKFDVATTRQAVLRAALAGLIEADT